MTAADIVTRAKVLYTEKIGPKVEQANHGRYIAIDVDSGDYEIGDDRLQISARLKSRQPKAAMSVLRIGFPAVGRIGSRNRPVSA